MISQNQIDLNGIKSSKCIRIERTTETMKKKKKWNETTIFVLAAFVYYITSYGMEVIW